VRPDALDRTTGKEKPCGRRLPQGYFIKDDDFLH
jgi:hypothetical protein